MQITKGQKIALWVLAGLAALAFGLWFFVFRKKRSANDADGYEPYYTAAAYAFCFNSIHDEKNGNRSYAPWRTPASDEYGPIYGTASLAFGLTSDELNDWNRSSTGKVTINSIFNWFKGMNIDPVHCQGWMLNNDVKASIIQMSDGVRNQPYWNTNNVKPGSFLQNGVPTQPKA